MLAAGYTSPYTRLRIYAHGDSPQTGSTQRGSTQRGSTQTGLQRNRKRSPDSQRTVTMAGKRRKVSSMLALAVLAQLAEGPMHPYEIAATLRSRGKEHSI